MFSHPEISGYENILAGRLYTEMVIAVPQHNATENLEMCLAEPNAINTDGTDVYGPLSETCRDIGLVNLIIVVQLSLIKADTSGGHFLSGLRRFRVIGVKMT